MTKTIVASIFWGFYESAEIRLIDKYFKGDVDAIEFGASSGVVSSWIISKFTRPGKRYIGVEANRHLKGLWSQNASRYNRLSMSLKLKNAAVYYDAGSVKFDICSNPTSSAVGPVNSVSNDTIEIEAIQLSDIISSENIQVYALFCDIEGAEVAIFYHENESLRKCKYLFIELHHTFYRDREYSVNDLKMTIENHGFDMVEQHGAVFYFENSNIL